MKKIHSPLYDIKKTKKKATYTKPALQKHSFYVYGYIHELDPLNMLAMTGENE